jgi:hypothetical protein
MRRSRRIVLPWEGASSGEVIVPRPCLNVRLKLNGFCVAYPTIGFAQGLLTFDYAIEELDYDQAG